MRSGVATAVSNSIQPPCTRSTRSSAPITSAPASRASRSFSPLANTATRTVLPMPCGSTTAPRTIWSACFGSTPRRNERSTDWSNFAAGMLFTSATASSNVYCLSGAIFAAASLYRLPVRLLTIVAMSLSPTLYGSLGLRSLHDIDAHAAGGAFDGADRRVDRVGVQVHQFALRDLPNLLARDLADLVLVGHRRRLGDSRGALEQHRRRRRLHDERERPVLVDRHHDRQDQSLLAARLRVEALTELHDVDAMLTERRPDRRRRIRLAGGDL